MEAELQGEGIYKLLPQRPPIVMVDTFFGLSDNSSFTGLTVEEENIFCQDGVLHEAGVIEHIAQSAAARVGYIYMQQNKEVPLGFIGSVDKLKLYTLPCIGSELRTQINIIQEVGDITLIAAQVEANSDLIAECRMKIFLKKDQ